MIIHLDRTCETFNYKHEIHVKSYQSDSKTKANSIIITLNDREVIIPLANVLCIETEIP